MNGEPTMKLDEAFLYSVKSLSIRSLRSWLTITGMVIGVIALVVILSVSEGFQKDINTQLSSFGSDTLIIFPVSSSSQAFSLSFARPPTSGKLFEEDVTDILGIPGVDSVSRSNFGRASLSFKAKNITATVYSSDRESFEQLPDYLKIESGRLYKEGEHNVAVFAADATTDLFGKDKVQVGSVIMINQKNYRVVGVLERIGSSLSSTDDKAIYIPFDDGKKVFAGQIVENEVGYISVKIKSGFEANQIKNSIERKLASNHHVRADDLDFSVITSEQIMETVGGILFASQLVLGAVALIASVVGAIGISNTMFMNVLERIKEIGIIKSIGGTGNDILKIFLIESAIIGFAGGLIGLIIGFIILEILQNFLGVPVFLRLRIVAFVFLFSLGTGFAAGLIPAFRAAKMDPIEALRYD